MLKNLKIRGSTEVGNGILKLQLSEPIHRNIEGRDREINVILINSGSFFYKGGIKPKPGTYVSILSNLEVGRMSYRTARAEKQLILNRSSFNTIIEVKESEEERVLKWINDDFNLNIDYAGYITNPDEIPEDGVVHKNDIDFQELFRKIKTYIQEHPNQGALSGNIISARMARGTRRPWWTPENPEENRLVTQAWETGSDTAGGIKQIVITRNGGSNRFLHPNSFSQEQYEELKQLIPTACKHEGCYNNYADSRGYHPEDETRVVDGRCQYHRRTESGVPTPPRQAEGQSSGDVPESERETIFKNALNSNSELRKLLEVNAMNRDYFIGIAQDSWINTNGTINLSEIWQFFCEAGWTVPEPEQNPSRETPTTPRQPSEPDSPDLPTLKNNAITTIKKALNGENINLVNSDWEFQIQATNLPEVVKKIREEVLNDIVTQRANKRKAEELANNLHQAQNQSGESLANNLKNMAKDQGEQAYEGQRKQVEVQWDRLAAEDPELFWKTKMETIENNLAKNEISANDLPTEIKQDWTKLKAGEIKVAEQVKETEGKITQCVGKMGAEKKFTNLVNQVNNALKSGKLTKIKEVKSQLLDFIAKSRTNIYWEKLVASKKTEIQKLLNSLENFSQQSRETKKPEKFPWGVVIPVFLIVLVALVAVVIVRKKQLRS